VVSGRWRCLQGGDHGGITNADAETAGFAGSQLNHTVGWLVGPIRAARQSWAGAGIGFDGDHTLVLDEHHVERGKGAVHPETLNGCTLKAKPHAVQGSEWLAQLHAHALLPRFIGHFQSDAGAGPHAPLCFQWQVLRWDSGWQRAPCITGEQTSD
jgi:hypothetical protein